MTQPALSEVLALLDQPAFQNPFTTFMLEDGWEATSGPRELPQLRHYLRAELKPFIEAVNLPFLTELTATVQRKYIGDEEIDLASLGLTAKEPTYGEVQQAMAKIHALVNQTQLGREECNHYIAVINTASLHLSALSKTIEAFLVDEVIHKDLFNHLSERKRFAEAITADLDIYGQRLKQLKATFSTLIENILQPRQNNYMRVDSAIRLLAKVDEQDRQFNRRISEPDTRAPVEGEDVNPFRTHVGGLDVEEA